MTDAINPAHYRETPTGIEYECIEYARYMSFDTGNAAKYAYRAGVKADPVTDLRKCHWYLSDAIHSEDADATSLMMVSSVDPDATRRSRLFHYIITGETYRAREYVEALLETPTDLDEPLRSTP